MLEPLQGHFSTGSHT